MTKHLRKSHLFMPALAVFIFVAATAVSGDTNISIVQIPASESHNNHYVNNRAPLRQNALIKLPVGSVQADGWLLETLHRQRDGLTGQLNRISAWLQKDDNAWLRPDGLGKWGWEEVPYWLKGYISLAYLLGDSAMIEESDLWIEAVFASQREDGNFGPLRVYGDDDSQDFWANMVMLNCLQTYYEHTEDERVLDLMTAYFRYQLTVSDGKFLTHYWQRMRGGDNLHSVYWLYNRTGDKWLLELARKTHSNTADWTIPGDLPNWHNVNIAQAFGEPASYYLLSKNDKHLQFAYRNFLTVRRLYGQVPGGMFGGDENSRGGFGDPRQAVETCGMVEQMLSDEVLYRITGDSFWADHTETVAFNSLPAAFTADYRALRYLTSPNMISSDRYDHAPGYENGGPMTMMNPLSHRCCQHNHSHGWPYFVENMWLATNDNGLCTGMLGPSKVTAKVGDGDVVSISTSTKYPFEEQIDYEITTKNPVEFPLYLRIPSWCKSCETLLNGNVVAGDMMPGGYVRLERKWDSGDKVTLRIPMSIRLDTWQANHNSASVSRGPITYSLKIQEKATECNPRSTALHDSQWQEAIDFDHWPAIEITADSPWNYGLVLSDRPEDSFHFEQAAWPNDNYPFSLEGTPAQITCKAKRIPEWKSDHHGLCSPLQSSPVLSDEPTEKITLIPMGAARLRISAFPIIGDDPNAIQWQKPAEPKNPPYRITASHCFKNDTVDAVADALLPSSSGDKGIPRHTFWPHVSTDEWLQANFTKEKEISKFSIYWFDDSGAGGGCRVPIKWKLLYLKDEGWKPVETNDRYGVATDHVNSISFTPVNTTAVRLEIGLREGSSAGVLEWNIE